MRNGADELKGIWGRTAEDDRAAVVSKDEDKPAKKMRAGGGGTCRAFVSLLSKVDEYRGERNRISE